MPKLYKTLVLFVWLIAMNIDVQARLGLYPRIFLSSDRVMKNKPTTIRSGWNILVHPFGYKEVTNFFNYPNPAVTQTTVSYTLSAKANVTLKVIDLAGKQLAVLVKQ